MVDVVLSQPWRVDDVLSEAWHACSSNVETNEYFYVKVVASPPPPSPDCAADDKFAFVLLVTDLLGVWCASVQHANANRWVEDVFPNVEDSYVEVFGMLRDSLVGKREVPNFPPTIQVAAALPFHSLTEPPMLRVSIWLSSRRSCAFECMPLSLLDSATLLRDQMIIPLMHTGTILCSHSTVPNWTVEQARREAEEASSRSSRFEFKSAAIAEIYRVSMLSRYRSKPEAAAPAALQPTEGTGLPPEATRNTTDVGTISEQPAARGASPTRLQDRSQPRLAVKRPRPDHVHGKLFR